MREMRHPGPRPLATRLHVIQPVSAAALLVPGLLRLLKWWRVPSLIPQVVDVPVAVWEGRLIRVRLCILVVAALLGSGVERAGAAVPRFSAPVQMHVGANP